VAPAVVHTGYDLQLLAVCHVDPGHPKYKIRARCRVIVRNNSDKAGSKMTLVGEGLGPAPGRVVHAAGLDGKPRSRVGPTWAPGPSFWPFPWQTTHRPRSYLSGVMVQFHLTLRTGYILAAALTLLLAGCAKHEQPLLGGVTGRTSLDGEPLGDVALMFVPMASG